MVLLQIERNTIFNQTIDKKERQIKHTHIHTICFYAYFLSITCKSIICVSNDTNYCAFLYCSYNHYFISTGDNLMYAFLSLYPDVFTTHLLFNAHKRNQLTGFLQQFVENGVQ